MTEYIRKYRVEDSSVGSPESLLCLPPSEPPTAEVRIFGPGAKQLLRLAHFFVDTKISKGHFSVGISQKVFNSTSL